jgi:endonuclease YncB( thermonuclease family)
LRFWRAPRWRDAVGHYGIATRLGRGGAWPIGAWPWLLITILVGTLVFHAIQHPNDRWPAWIHGNIAGKVRVIDDDTIVMAGTHIRLNGIDAPESDQTCTDAANQAWLCGKAATRALQALMAGRPLNCETSGHDRYHRVLAVCTLPDGTDINAWMVQPGWALAYYSHRYDPEEAEAHAAKRGIWASSFIPPWEWRHRHLH